MGRVIGELDTRKFGNRRAMLLADISYQRSDGRTITVPKGFVYDGGSIPRFFWAIVPPFGTAADWAWLFHDWLYYCHRELYELTWSRKEADGFMKAILYLKGVNSVITEGAYQAVRKGAAYSWATREEREQFNMEDPDADFLDA